MITQMQRSCIELASHGLTVYEISLELGISIRTVEYHLAEARDRLDARNTTHAVANAMRLNIIRSLLFICCINAVSLNYSLDMRRPVRTRTTNTIRIARNLQSKTGRQES